MARTLAWVVIGSAVLACKPAPSNVAPESEPGHAPPAVIVESTIARVAPACATRTGRGSLGLIPDGLDLTVHVGPRELMRSTLWSLLAPALAQDPEWQSVERPFAACGVGLDTIDHVLLGLSLTGGEFVVVMTAPSIGRPDVATCVIEGIQALAADTEAVGITSWAEEPSVPIIQFTDGRAYLFADDVLAIATTSLADRLGRLGRCEGTPAVGGRTRELFTRVDLDAAAWAVGRLDPALVGPVLSGAGVSDPGVEQFALSLAVRDGVTLSVSADVRDAAMADQAVTQLQSLLVILTQVSTEFGAVANRTELQSAGASVQLRMSATDAELLSIANQ